MDPVRACVLLIDDEPAMLRLLRDALPVEEFEVTTAGSCEEAVAAARRSAFDLAVTDLYMPKQGGLETMAALKAAQPDLEVIVSTGQPSHETAIAALKQGAYDYISKPLNIVELRHCLHRAFERSRLGALSALYGSSRELLANPEDPGLPARAVRCAAQVLRVQVAALLLLPGEGSEERLWVHPDERASELDVDALEELARSSIAGISAPLAGEYPGRSGTGLLPAIGQVAWLVCPLFRKGMVSGALTFLRDAQLPAFNAAEARRGGLFAAQTSLALENWRLCDELAGKVAEATQAHQRVVQAEARALLLLESTQEGIFQLDEQGTILEANDMAGTLLLEEPQALIGRSLAELLASGAAEARAWLGRSATLGQRPHSGERIEASVRRSDGQTFEGELWLSRAHTEVGDLISAFLQDVSERKGLEVELRHAQKLESVGRLAAGVAHEINTPIQFVGDNLVFLGDSFEGFRTTIAAQRQVLAALENGEPAEEAARRARSVERKCDLEYLLGEVPAAIEQAKEGVDRVAGIVRAMKEFAHPDRREKSLADLNRALRSTLLVATNELKYVAEIETSFGDIPPVPCHLSDLNQVFLNLFTNAAHAIASAEGKSGKKGVIRVETACEDGEVRVSVSDTGIGIPPENHARVFEPFFTTKEVGRGTGQGLAIARSIVVDKHGGSLQFESVPGQGTTFHVRVPIQEVKGEGRA